MKTDNIKIKPSWEKSKEEIWNEKFEHLEVKTLSRSMNLRKNNRIWRYAAVAAIAVILTLPSISYFYTKNLYVPKGEHLLVALPDGSTVQLNADTRLSYKPLWWRVSREVKLDGEAYFEVAKGSDFKVRSSDATVTVLGTSFNIYARKKVYHVTCLTGRVEVTRQQQSVILTPGMKTVVENSILATHVVTDTSNSIGWTKFRFIFNGVPLSQVIEEIERQYDIEIIVSGVFPDNIYSGNFSRTDDPAEVLEIIGRPFGLDLKIKQTH